MHDNSADVIKHERTLSPNIGVRVDLDTRAKSTKLDWAAVMRFLTSTFMFTGSDRYGPKYRTAENSLPGTGDGHIGGVFPPAM